MPRNVYAGLQEIKDAARIMGTIDDDLIINTAEDVSREIDLDTGRQFFEMTATKYFTARESDCCAVPDLLSITTLRADIGENRTYSSTFSSTGYELSPANATMESPPRPYSEIETTPLSTNTFSTAPRAVMVTGTWGFYGVTEQRGTIAGASGVSSTGTTSIVVSDGTKVQAGHTIRRGAEQMYVNDVQGTTALVDRGVNGTTPTTHAVSSTYGVYTYPVIRRACILQTARILARHEAALGVVGSADVGQIRLTAALDPDVKKLLERFVLPVLR